jgi:hypothetical protein
MATSNNTVSGTAQMVALDLIGVPDGFNPRSQLIRRFHDTTAGTALVQTGRREPSPISALNCRCRRAVEASGRWSLPYAAPAWRGGQPALGVA